jgi:hypothetical protein
VSFSHTPASRRSPRYTTIPDFGSLSHPEGRHPTLGFIEDNLHDVTIGASTTALDECDRPAGVFSLPTVLWMRGPTDHPKSRRGLLPHPISWSTQPLLRLHPGETLHASWTVRIWGQRLAGTLELAGHPDATGVRTATNVDAEHLLAPKTARIVAPSASVEQQRRLVRRAVDEASAARWRLHEFLEPWLRRSLAAAHRAVSAELRVARVLDEISLDDLFTELFLGESGRPGLVDKAIKRLATPTLPRPNVDASRYIVTTFRRDAELALRRRIDDPRWVGPALRRFAASHPELTGLELVDAYNRSSCTTERIGLDRAMRALHPSVQPMTVNLAVETMAARSEPHPSEVFLRPIEGGRSGAGVSASTRTPDRAMSA